MANRIVEMSGSTYGKLVAVRLVGRTESRGSVWLMRCSCGTEFEAEGATVRRGQIKSCRSCSKETKRAAKSTHGMTESPEYANWCAMKSRCNNPSFNRYADYGGRGIKVCSRWLTSFENFFSDMGSRPTRFHTVERIDNDKSYSKRNCRWATRKEQSNNKRNNRIIEIDGRTRTLSQWAEESQVNESTIRSRLRRGLVGMDLLKQTT